ncbi:MAG: TRAP transporter small permease [Lawsonibacter sp.]|jgi:TRAP-type C4-dicarboxylate transport system permease small subunit
MKVLRAIDKHLEEYLLVGSFFVTVTVIFVQVVCRYVFKNSLSWSEELARYIFVWQIWLGASYAAKINKHINITVARERFPQKVQIILEALVLILWAAFAVFMVYKGKDVIEYILKSKQRTPALQIPMAIPYLSVPVGCGLMAIRIIQNFIYSIPDWKARWAK